MDVYRMRDHCNIWQAHNDVRARTVTIHDHRKVSRGYTERPMTDAEFELCEFAEPEFDDFNELWRRVETFLQRRELTRCATERHPERIRRIRVLAMHRHEPATALWRR